MFFFGLVVAIFLGIVFYVAVTGLYTIVGNFVYTMALGVMIYLIAFQAILNDRVLKPDFTTKYNTKKIALNFDEEVIGKLLQLFEDDKVFVDPQLKIAGLAKKVGVTSHHLSRVINDKLNKNFNELMNQYRINEFKARVNDQKYASYSILGIAYDVGYNSKSSFNEAFKKQNGLTPSEYLRSPGQKRAF
ncbi:MAG TPA: helix-turn-helix domain-containing protein [Mucilaginibacter sp.]|jgi:AraC-like DNA-binding protein|nr:helix-turn-helix domain-containing protein [Mucilaginibacter sp.]